jgi:NAD(P)-dependent dehydrogenase (short-subunit alcohol dehydrogenase family)
MSRWTVTDIPDQNGRTAVVTGANTGIGYEIAIALAARGANVVLAVRNLRKGMAAAELIARRYPDANVAVQELDLASLASVADAADALRSSHDRIDLLINNAGVSMTPKSTTHASSCKSAPTTSALLHSPDDCWTGSSPRRDREW